MTRTTTPHSPTERTTWTVAEAKSHLSELIGQAESSGPQTITRHGKPAVVVVSAQEWERKTKRKGTLVEFFANSPLRNSGLVIERVQDMPRKIDL
jgi:prevent-host-death family protein